MGRALFNHRLFSCKHDDWHGESYISSVESEGLTDLDIVKIDQATSITTSGKHSLAVVVVVLVIGIVELIGYRLYLSHGHWLGREAIVVLFSAKSGLRFVGPPSSEQASPCGAV